MEVNEDLTMEERRVRWKLVERARSERVKRKVVVTTNRRIWISKAWRIWKGMGMGYGKKWVI